MCLLYFGERLMEDIDNSKTNINRFFNCSIDGIPSSASQTV